jgi:GNAT superfamily N-acetyltransferase
MPINDILQKENLYRLVCRPALPRDTSEVLEFTRTIWEGEDYIPNVWAEWLSDPEGLLSVAEFGGKVVGISKLTKLSDIQWWLEGLRVHPLYVGQGIASRLHDYLLDFWDRTGTGTIRLVTASFREPVHHLAQRTGFQQLEELTLFAAESEEVESPTVFSLISEDEISQAGEFIKNSETFQLVKSLIDLGWQWAVLESGFLYDAVRCKQAWWWRDREGLLIAREDDEDQIKTRLIQLLACSGTDASKCLFEFRQLGKELGSRRVGWFVQVNPILVRFLEQAGYRREWEASLFLFEKTQICH